MCSFSPILKAPVHKMIQVPHWEKPRSEVSAQAAHLGPEVGTHRHVPSAAHSLLSSRLHTSPTFPPSSPSWHQDTRI